ncbi:hypothetical protein ACRDNQ_10885 [Palleronia sp. KMU-117]|uniref:hypothetical protein n=1 Tax=Palleronia sp. KMU-117 TaxID=3434108 RepID=UPI003D75DE62
MRSIAEYFRDLAADDRYFGAEPPTPDAEMLHRIAEKEIQRRVEARVQDNGIVLKQLSDGDAAPAATRGGATTGQAAAAATTAFAPVAKPTYAEPEFEADLEPSTSAADFPESQDVADVTSAPDAPQAETVAEKLSRIRAVVSAARAEPASAADDADDAQPGDETLVDAALVAEAAEGDDSGFEGDATEMEIAEALAVFDEDEDEDGVAVVETTDTVEAEDEVADGEAAEDLSEMPAEETAIEESVTVALAADEFSADEAELDAGDDHETVAEERWDEPMVAAIDETDESDEIGDLAPEDLSADDADASDAEPYGHVVKLNREEFQTDQDGWSDAETTEAAQALTDESAAAEAEDAAATETDWAAFDDDEDDDDDDTVAEDRLAEPAQDAAWAAGSEIGEDDSDDASDDADLDPIAAGIRAAISQHADETAKSERESADEADRAAFAGFDDEEMDDDFEDEDLEAEDTRRDWGWDDADETGDETDEDVSAGAMAARERLGPLSEPEGDAADVDRLLEKTNSQMAETENSRRRSAIAHLKAAVAATKADRLLKRVTSREKTDAEVQTQYRDDLAHVVRPRRPAAEAADVSRERPKPLGEGKTPLMLVSELRVDDAASRVLSPIRPRRIMHDEDGEGAPEVESSSYEDAARFAEFAEKMGAKDLTDLLEAAAAYAAYVENRPHFSRPQLMKRVARYEASGEFTREAGLRSFGQLLRQGKIRKLKRGQFTVAESTRFNPEARIAGE